MDPARYEVGREVSLSPEAAADILPGQNRPGGIITLTDSRGHAYRGRTIGPEGAAVRVFVFEALGGPAESALELILLQALPDKERMEWIIQKATELGADLIVPFHSARSIRLDQREAKQKKAHRWPEIALAAARQCRRARLPWVAPVTDLEGALGWAANAEVKIAVWEKEKHAGLRERVTGRPRPASAALLVGPEGGLEESEVAVLRAADFAVVSLGRRILRTETAAMAGLALLQYEWGDLGGGGD